MTRLFLNLLVVSFSLGALAFGQALPGKAGLPRVVPHPQIENYGQGVLKLADATAGGGYAV